MFIVAYSWQLVELQICGDASFVSHTIAPSRLNWINGFYCVCHSFLLISFFFRVICRLSLSLSYFRLVHWTVECSVDCHFSQRLFILSVFFSSLPSVCWMCVVNGWIFRLFWFIWTCTKTNKHYLIRRWKRVEVWIYTVLLIRAHSRPYPEHHELWM